MSWQNSIAEALQNRVTNGNFRSLKSYSSDKIDFFSNDYLGLSRNKNLLNDLSQWFSQHPEELTGATGSRLISGNSETIEQIENFIAKKHQQEAALFFSSGYQANLALFSCLPKRGDTVLVDEFIHRSVLDGVRLSFAEKRKFKHNDLEDLERQLKKARGKILIAVESLYSMDGDFAPLRKIIALSEKYNAAVIVEEAHSFGVFGLGLVNELGLTSKVFASIITYGKAMGMHGACILGSSDLKSYLVNFASPFIYSTGSPISAIRSIEIGYHFLEKNKNLKQNLQDNIQLLRNSHLPWFSEDKSPIQILKFKNCNHLQNVHQILLDNGILSSAIRSPTVKEGDERMRICVHAFNSRQEIDFLKDLLTTNF